MKCLISSLLFALMICLAPLVQAAEPVPPSMQPSKIEPIQQTAKPAEVDMNQFKNLPPPDKRSKVHADVNCQAPDGAILKLGDAGFKECMELKANRVMNQPHSPEAAPYDPRTK
jgi:hypothetical protein